MREGERKQGKRLLQVTTHKRSYIVMSIGHSPNQHISYSSQLIQKTTHSHNNKHFIIPNRTTQYVHLQEQEQ